MSGLLKRLHKQVAYLDSLEALQRPNETRLPTQDPLAPPRHTKDTSSGSSTAQATHDVDLPGLWIEARDALAIVCGTCRANRWWLRHDRQWVCGICHPQPPAAKRREDHPKCP